MSAAIIALYVWKFLSKDTAFSQSLTIDIPVLALAGVTTFLSFVAYIWVPKKAIFIVSLTIYLLLAVMTALLIIDTGGVSSPFIALLVLIIIFSDVFGLWGLIPMLIAISVFTAGQYMNGNLTIEAMIIIAFSGLVPLIASLLIWHNDTDDIATNTGGDNKAYRNLANELSEVANKSEVVINAIGDGVMAIDSKGIVRLINPAAQNIIGIGKQDALSLNYKSVLHMLNQKNEVIDITNDPIQQVLNLNQQIRTNDTNILTSSGKKINASLVISPVGDAGSGVIAVFRDITKEKANEREQAEFISTASHEMRTPVASIEGYLGLALNTQTAQIDERARGFILKAHESAEHLGHLFQDLLDISKADDNRLSNNPKVINIIDFTHDVVRGLEQKALDKGIKLSYIPMPDNDERRHITPVYYVNLDGDHIREIINNLVENAIKYTKEGEVEIDINGNDDRIVISVKDSGIGIPNEDMPHLFQKFYRVDDKNTREIGGTGLGLYLCRRLVEIMGGRIWVESKYNRGSTFFVELPRISNQEAKILLEQPDANSSNIDQASQNTATININQPSTIMPEPIRNTQTDIGRPANTVPRGEALTPAQIAEYVAKQHELLSKQPAVVIPQAPVQTPAQPQPAIISSNTNNPRPQSISVPSRSTP